MIFLTLSFLKLQKGTPETISNVLPVVMRVEVVQIIARLNALITEMSLIKLHSTLLNNMMLHLLSTPK